jgi:hypothetical protein
MPSWPLVLNPVLDGLLVAFGGLPLGPLHRPAQPPRSNISIIPTSPNNSSAG